jgi:hypothetical protein
VLKGLGEEVAEVRELGEVLSIGEGQAKVLF